MIEPALPSTFTERRLREVLEGQTLRLADSSFAVVAKHRRHHLVHLDLEADDGSPSTLTGIPGAASDCARERRRYSNRRT
ncbi:hypothetical protein ACFVTM_17950 [Arthrobacter sp. NPDC058130]|uniref:hypothetical protein n=1 Tax=Arthrobacter sp. NPDC058130 TaxID=3346353 RepID=UPI0036F16670